MKKAPEAFRTISEVAELLDTPAHMLRFWESKFYQIRPVKRAGGRRYYRPDDVALLNGIRILLQEQKQTMRGVQRLLQEKGVRHVVELGSRLPPRRPAAASPGDAEVAAGQVSEAPVEADQVEAAPVEAAQAVAPPGPEAPPPLPAARPPPPPPPRPPAPLPMALSTAAAEHPAAMLGCAPTARPVEPPPDPSVDAAQPRLAQLLRALPREALAAHRDRLAVLARRIDALLDRMSEASGAGRW